MTPNFKFSLDPAAENSTANSPQPRRLKTYIPPDCPPSTEELDSMPRWEYDWWQGWIERHP